VFYYELHTLYWLLAELGWAGLGWGKSMDRDRDREYCMHVTATTTVCSLIE